MGCNNTETNTTISQSVLILCLSFNSMAAILGNTINLIVLTKVKKMMANQVILLRILAITDFVSGTQCFVGVIQQCFPHLQSCTHIICKLSGLILSLCCANASFTLVLIAVDKTVSIVKPLQYHSLMTPYRIKAVMALSVLLQLALLLYISSGDPNCGNQPQILSNVIYMQEWGNCIIDFHNPALKMGTLSLYLYVVVLPAVMIASTYFLLATVSCRQSRQIAASVRDSKILKDLRKKELKGLKLAFAITISFLLSWVMFSTLAIRESFTEKKATPVAKLIGGVLAISSSWTNTFIYFFIYAEFRRTAKKLFYGKLKSVSKMSSSKHETWFPRITKQDTAEEERFGAKVNVLTKV